MACTVHSFTPAIFMCAELLRGDRSVLQGYSHNVSVMRTSAIKCKGHATRGGSCKWDAAAGAGIILTGRWGWAGQRLGKHAHAKALPLATPIGVDGKRRGAVAVVAVVAGAVGAAGAAGAASVAIAMGAERDGRGARWARRAVQHDGRGRRCGHRPRAGRRQGDSVGGRTPLPLVDIPFDAPHLRTTFIERGVRGVA